MERSAAEKKTYSKAVSNLVYFPFYHSNSAVHKHKYSLHSQMSFFAVVARLKQDFNWRANVKFREFVCLTRQIIKMHTKTFNWWELLFIYFHNGEKLFIYSHEICRKSFPLSFFFRKERNSCLLITSPVASVFFPFCHRNHHSWIKQTMQSHEFVLIIFIALHSICMIPLSAGVDAKGKNNIEATYNLHK